jgi:hypothetical protein
MKIYFELCAIQSPLDNYGNYTQEREVLLDKNSLDEIVSEIEKRRKPAQ